MQHQAVEMINVDMLSEKVGGRYALTVLVAKRLRDLNGGAPLLVERRDVDRLIDCVCREIEEGKIWLERAATDGGVTYAKQEDIGELLDLD